MFTVLYRWRIKPGLEEQFVESWSAVTKYYRSEHGSLGSRLHRAQDGSFYGYAQWPSEEHRRRVFETAPRHPASAAMREAIAEEFSEVILEVLSDYLVVKNAVE